MCPTISGNTVEVRDQVLIMCFWFCSFICVIRLIRRSSTNGPFFEDLLIRYLCLVFLPRRRPRTIIASERLPFLRVR